MSAPHDLYLTDVQYIQALKNLRHLVETGVKLEYFDDDTPGCKDTQCTWGLCTDSKRVWPDPDMHLWPDEFLKRGRSAPKYRDEKTQVCPFENPEVRNGDQSGCFYFCRVFSPRKAGPRWTKDAYLARIDKLILIAQARVATPS